MLLALANGYRPPRRSAAARVLIALAVPAALSLAVLSLAARALAGEPDVPLPVALVRGTNTEKADPEGEGPVAARAARLVANSLARAGVPFDLVGDDEAASGALAGRRLAILPYNPVPSPGEREALAEFVERGGRLIVFYVADRSLWNALGISEPRVRPRSRKGEFAEMRFAPGAPPPPPGEGGRSEGRTGALAFLPPAVFQDSWNIMEVDLVPGATVLARWHDDEGRPARSAASARGEGPPAVVLGRAGVFFTHIMLGHPTEAKARACMALAAELAGGALLEPVARARLREARDVPAWEGLAGLADLARAAGDPPAEVRRAQSDGLVRSLQGAARAERAAKAALEVAAYVEALKQATLARTKAREALGHAFPARDGEIRAIWVRRPEAVVWADVAPVLSEAGFNMVLPNYVRGLRAAWKSRLLETPQAVPRAGSLAACIRECRRAGIEVHVWWTVLFLDDTPRESVARLEREGRLVVDDEGRAVTKAGAGWLCPSSEENLELLGEVARELIRRFRPDGLHLDYVRLPGERSCLCESCRERFGAVPPEAGAAAGGERARDFRRFRRGLVTGVVERIAGAARGVRPGVYVSAAVFPELAACRETLAQDWGEWVSRGILDLVMPMDYTDSPDELAGWVSEQARRLGGRVPLAPGIGLAAGRVGIHDPAELLHQIAVARAAGADGYAIFQLPHGGSWDGFRERYLTLLAAGPGRRGSETPPHGGPALSWKLPRGVDPRAIPAGRAVEVRLRTGLRSQSGLAAGAFGAGRSSGGRPKVEIETASGRWIADLGAGPPPGGAVRLRVVVPAGPFRIVARGRVRVEGRPVRAVAIRSPLYFGVTDAERASRLARSRPVGAGPRVAVLEGGYGSRGILAALRRSGSFAAYPVPSLEGLGGEVPERPSVLVLTQRRDPAELDGAARAAVRLFVEAGGSVLLTHDAVGYRYHPALFEEVAAGAGRAMSSVVWPIAGKGLAEAMGPAAVEHSHFDHLLLDPGEKGEVAATGGDEETGTGAVVCWGAVGEGRVAACGIAIGIDREEREHAPQGRENELLLALVKYLAGAAPTEGAPGAGER